MKLQGLFEASVLFEASIDLNGSNYLVIYGKHINGYFICIPNWGISCEAAEPSDVFYNARNLCKNGISIVESEAKALAQAIKQISEKI